ncbi:hypothetical protein AGMMS49942_23260 [Spirochaetia bacterium]|nr:hypothetical protein AGMMS49942_23260 [Spirochaetia bacterium]
MQKRTAFVLFACTLGLFSCKTAEFGYKVIDVNGMIYDFSNRPIPNYKIFLGEKYSSTTDINGRFLISKVPAGDYIIHGEGGGYESYQSAVVIYQREQIIYIRLPSFKQLLELADTALAKNQINEADAYLVRAGLLGEETTELLFYRATVRFRQKRYIEALNILQTAVNSGSTDMYVREFLNDLKRMQDENKF